MDEGHVSAIGPVPLSERITVIDCLRGAALFGILAANMRGFNSPPGVYFQPSLMWPGLPDRITQALIDWLVQGKFITIFAALFGVGFAIQMDRAAARNQGMGFYARRMAILAIFGLLHGLGIWWGDILFNYAVCGFFLMLFRRRSQKALLRWAHGMYWFLIVLFLGFVIASMFGAKPPAMPETTQDTIQQTVRIYSQGTIAEIFKERAQEWAGLNSFVLFLTRILGLFLFGMYIWRQGYLARPAEHLEWWKRVQRICLPLGLLGNALFVALDLIFHPSPMNPGPMTLLIFFIQSLALPLLSLFYASTIVLLYQDPVWQRRLEPFSYVGRMALTNYLLQSIICTTIFYSYGLGLFGKVGPLLALPLTVVVYGLQVPFSRWWLSRHRYGPMEWVWRRLTYGSLAERTAPPVAAL